MIENPSGTVRNDAASGVDRRIAVRDGEIDSQELFQTEREVKIRHGDQTYRLRLTGLNKLILTK
ncbi:MAG: hemin uptake protein HemP [Rhizobiales bacterium]|nr:hemin uptake protein HemP [Hyphomicrobiales bacterium]